MGKHTSLKARNFVSSSKYAVRVINSKNKSFHGMSLLREMNILSVYETNIFQTRCFMFNSKIGITPSVFPDRNRPKVTNTHCTPFESYLSYNIEERFSSKKSSIADIQMPLLFKTIIKTTSFNTANLITKFY